MAETATLPPMPLALLQQQQAWMASMQAAHAAQGSPVVSSQQWPTSALHTQQHHPSSAYASHALHAGVPHYPPPILLPMTPASSGAAGPGASPYKPSLPLPQSSPASAGSIGTTPNSSSSASGASPLFPNQALHSYLARQQFLLLQQQSQQLAQQTLLLQQMGNWTGPPNGFTAGSGGGAAAAAAGAFGGLPMPALPVPPPSAISGFATQRVSRGGGNGGGVHSSAEHGAATERRSSTCERRATAPKHSPPASSPAPYLDFTKLPSFERVSSGPSKQQAQQQLSASPPQKSRSTSRPSGNGNGNGNGGGNGMGRRRTAATSSHGRRAQLDAQVLPAPMSPLLPISFHAIRIASAMAAAANSNNNHHSGNGHNGSAGASAASSPNTSPRQENRTLSSFSPLTRARTAAADASSLLPVLDEEVWPSKATSSLSHSAPHVLQPLPPSAAASSSLSLSSDAPLHQHRGSARKTLTSQASLRSVYLAVGQGQGGHGASSSGSTSANGSSTPNGASNHGNGSGNGSGNHSALATPNRSIAASRRASLGATDSLMAGVPVALVSSLRDAGLVSTLFSASAAGTATPSTSEGNEQHEVDKRVFPWNLAAASAHVPASAIDHTPTPPSSDASTSAASAAAARAARASKRTSAVGSLSPSTRTPVPASPAGPTGDKEREGKQRSKSNSPSMTSSKPHRRGMSLVLTSPDNSSRILEGSEPPLISPSTDEANKLASALSAALELQDAQQQPNATAPSSAVVSAGVSPNTSAVPSPGGSVPTSPGHSRKSTRRSLDMDLHSSKDRSVSPGSVSPSNEPAHAVSGPGGSMLPPSAADLAAADGTLGNIIYITRDVVKAEKRTTALPAGVSAKEKARMDAAEKERKQRQAERERLKKQEADEKKAAAAEAAAAKESSRLAREKMKNMLAEQGLQRQREKEAREAAERLERAEKEKEERAAKAAAASRPGAMPSFLSRLRQRGGAGGAEESEARRKLRQELDPSLEAGAANDGEQDDDASSTTATHAPAEPRSKASRAAARMSMAPGTKLLVGATSATTSASPPAASKKKLLLLPARLITAAKHGDLDELRRVLQEEFGSTHPSPGAPSKSNPSETCAAFLNRGDKNGSALLAHAVWPGFEDFIAVLLELGANPDNQNLKRNTCMHLAVERGHDSIVRLLLRHGADPLLVNMNGDAPFQVLPSPKEQLQWASFLHITLEAIWKTANPGWVAPEKDEDASAAASAAVSPALSRMVTFTEVPKSPPQQPAEDPLMNSMGGGSDAVDSSELAVLDESADHSPLGPLNPSTPLWLRVLSQVVATKDASRTHTKQLLSRMTASMPPPNALSVVASAAVHMKHAVRRSRELQLLTDSTGSTGAASGAGLANLLRNLKAKERRSLGAMSSASGQDSGKNSARGSLNGSTQGDAPEEPRRRRLSDAAAGATSGGTSRSPSPPPPAAAAAAAPVPVSRRRSNEGASGASGVRAGAAAMLRATAARRDKPAASEKRRADKSPAAASEKEKDRAAARSSAAASTARRSSAGRAAVEAAAAESSASAAATSAAADAASPAADGSAALADAASAEDSAPVVPVLQYKIDPAPVPAVPVVAAQVKTFSIFSASLQELDQDEQPKQREANFSFWKT